MNKQSNNIQDIFLNNARKSKTLVSIYLVNGFQLRGFVKGFDNFTVILDCEGNSKNFNNPQEVKAMKNKRRVSWT